MRHTTTIFCGIALAAFATCGVAQQSTDQSTSGMSSGQMPNDQMSNGNTPEAAKGPMGNATPHAKTPTGGNAANGLSNTGNGLKSGLTEQQARDLFKNLDANSDGVVSGSEFRVNGDTGQRFPGCDIDGNHKLSWTEFWTCAQRMQGPTAYQQ